MQQYPPSPVVATNKISDLTHKLSSKYIHHIWQEQNWWTFEWIICNLAVNLIGALWSNLDWQPGQHFHYYLTDLLSKLHLNSTGSLAGPNSVARLLPQDLINWSKLSGGLYNLNLVQCMLFWKQLTDYVTTLKARETRSAVPLDHRKCVWVYLRKYWWGDFSLDRVGIGRYKSPVCWCILLRYKVRL